MKKTERFFNLLLSFLLITSLFIGSGCTKEEFIDDGKNGTGTTPNGGDETPSETLSFEWISEINDNAPEIMSPGNSISLSYKAENAESVTLSGTPEGWEAKVDTEAATIYIKAPENGQNQQFNLTVSIKGTDGTEQKEEVPVYYIASFDESKGTFILNEGNMTTENGSLTYITPEGYVIEDAYKLINGTELGNVCQDMYIHDGKIYIISQNGDQNPVGTEFENDGMLVIVDAKTLKKIDSYKKEELSGLTWPSHIAVLDEEHVYIRDNGVAEGDNGSGKIWRLNTKDRSLTEVQETTGVPKSPLFVKNNKVYTYKYSTLFQTLNYFYLLEISTQNDVATTYQGSTGEYKPINILPAQKDNTFWLMIQSEEDETAYKVTQISYRTDNKNISIKSPTYFLEDLPNTGASGRMLISPSDDTFYYTSASYIIKGTYAESGAGTSDGTKPVVTTEALLDLTELDPDAREVYNGMGIHPETGHIYINTIKGMGTLYTTSQIWEFDFNQSATEPVNKWSNCTRFPAGFFFPITN